MDLMSRFLKVPSPHAMTFWKRLRLLIAGVIYPDFKTRYENWSHNYFSNQYMLSVHKHYESQIKTLNKGLVNKSKQIKELQSRLKEYERDD
jgi:hypothetical protein